MTTVYLGGTAVRLHDRDLLGQGGEGRVYRAGDRALKIFHAPSAERRDKLRAFPAHLPAKVVGPLELCTDRAGEVVGYAMRRLDGAIDAHRLAQRKWRQGAMGAAEVLRVFRELQGAVIELHARGIVVGDLNDGNVVLTPAAAGFSPWLIDADSMQLPGHPCVVAHERFLDPRLYGVDLARTAALSKESDFYALAVLLFASLLFVHPFGGAHPSHPTMLRRAEARHSVLRADVKLPRSAVRPDVLPDDALAFFHEVFERDRRAPLPSPCLDARFTSCACGVEHARRSCPACAVRVHVRPQVRARGVLCARTVSPPERERIRAAVSRPCDAVRLEGDALVRASDGTRIGLVLEGQTQVCTGAALGFAFYRAGAITVAFVFDLRRGPLRQVDLPHIEGKLVDWSAVFDDHHVLVTFATEAGGKVVHAAHLVDARGEVVATERGAPEGSPVLASLAGRCLAGGAVLCATDDGLVLLRPDRASRAFAAARLFADAKDFVSPDADLVPGPGGSVYVVAHDEIVHLTFRQT